MEYIAAEHRLFAARPYPERDLPRTVSAGVFDLQTTGNLIARTDHLHQTFSDQRLHTIVEGRAEHIQRLLLVLAFQAEAVIVMR